MTISSRIATAVLGIGVVVAPALHAQSISIGLRGTGSFPTGSFSQQGLRSGTPCPECGSTGSTDAPIIEGAKNGFGYGLDVGLGLGMFGIYAGFDHIKFDCETGGCQSDGLYTLQGVTAGVKLAPHTSSMFHPFVKGGVTFNDLKGGYGGSSSNRLTTDKAPGYEIGAGVDLSLMGIFALTPQVRYVGQNLKTKIPGVDAPAAEGQGVNYFTFDLGFSVHTPFSGM